MTTTLPAPDSQGDDNLVADDPDLTGAEALRAVAQDVRGCFPRPLLRSELILIDVDPRQLHAFWNLPIADLETARRSLPESEAEAPMVLRIIGAGGTESFDIEVQGLQNQIYVDVWADERSYRAVLGLRRSNGSIVPLLSSEPATLPHLGRGAEVAAPDTPPEPEPAAAGGTDAAPAEAVAAAEQPPPLELETVLALSSFAMGSEIVQLELNAELRIFGRTKPGSELRLFGRRVALKPDGSFSISRPLPNGALVMTALLTGGDGD